MEIEHVKDKASSHTNDSSATDVTTSITTTSDENSTEDSPFDSPPVQKMERPPEGPSNYRLPSHVFGIGNSKSAIEWSATSNESLFSINMGNTSFTKEQFNSILKSGELSAAEIARLGDPRKSVNLEEQTSLAVQGQATTTSSTKSEKLGDGGHELSPGSTSKNQGFTVKTDYSKNGKPSNGDESSPFSRRHSDASNQSFAFPVLATDFGPSSSVKSRHEQTNQQQKTDNVGSEATTKKPAESSFFTSCFSWCPCS